jgi:diguanylate cyclase (GGDEF)-like protein/PAS domain S-box-containing protein
MLGRHWAHAANVKAAVSDGSGSSVAPLDERERRLQLVAGLISVADEAPTVEEALRAALSLLCDHTGWQAGRLQFADEAGDLGGRTFWHLTRPESLASLRAVAEERRASLNDRSRPLQPHAEWVAIGEEQLQQSGAHAVFSVPVVVRGRLFVLLEFFSQDAQRPPDALLDVIAYGCTELGRILQRKPAEDALRRSEREYRALFENAHDGILITDPEDETVIDANQSACAIYGCLRSDLIGLPLHTLWKDPSHDRSRLKEALRGPSRRFESSHFRKDEQLIVVEVSAGPVEYQGRRALWMSVRDITEKLRTLEQLRVSEARYRHLFESSPQPMWVASGETNRFLEVNEAAVRRYGYTREQFAQMTTGELAATPLPESSDHKPQLEETTVAPTGATIWRHRTSAGEPLHVEVTSHGIDFAGAKAMLVVANDVTERLRAEESLWHAAYFDALTGLPNRALFMERLSQTQARMLATQAGGFAVLFLDIDRFKVINDSLGHRAGDVLLVQIAQRLEKIRRVGDTVARLGGDEFAVLVEEVHDHAEAVLVAERIHNELAVPFDLSEEQGPPEVFSSASIGIALGRNTEGTHQPVEELLRDADTAMYRAKGRGAGQHALFDVAMHDRAVAVLQMESDLRRAIDREELRVFFQPIVALPEGRIVGFEALCRWPHRTRGWIPPGDFIPLAEETGLIGRVDRWVLEEACKRMCEFQQINPRKGALTLSVNLSGRELLQHDLADQVAAILKRTGLSPRSLKLEITESVLVENEAQARRCLSSLKELGVALCLDDFGTGYSSLSYLHRMPVDGIKVDVSFVRTMGSDEKNRRIVESVVLLGKKLGLEVVAEGVETPSQAAQLLLLGCTLAQGYLYGAPFDAETAKHHLRQREGRALTVDGSSATNP